LIGHPGHPNELAESDIFRFLRSQEWLSPTSGTSSCPDDIAVWNASLWNHYNGRPQPQVGRLELKRLDPENHVPNLPVPREKK
jgi:hypothetical protein